MKGKIKTITKKVFALAMATAMSIPTAAFASDNQIKLYDQNSSVMGLIENREINKEIIPTEGNFYQRENDHIKMEVRARLESLDKIIYEIKISKKNTGDKVDQEINLNLTPNPNSSINKVKLQQAKALSPEGEKEIDFEEIEKTTDLKDLNLKGKIKDEIILEAAADIREAKDARTYDMLVSLYYDKDSLNLKTNFISQKEITKENDKEVEKTSLKVNDKKTDNLKGQIEAGDLFKLFSTKETILWTDYLANDTKESENLSYEFKLDDKQDTKDTKINLDYYENSNEGYILKKEFSQSIDFSNKIEFEIPAGYIAKLSLKTKVDKNNPDVKAYSLNGRQVKNPSYKDKKDGGANDEEDGPGEDSHIEKEEESEESKEDDHDIKIEDAKSEKESDTDIRVTDSSGNEIPVEVKEKEEESQEENKANDISALILNKDSLISRLKAENKLDPSKEEVITNLAENLNSYNEEKISDQELKDFTKAQATNTNIDKADLRFFIESILSGLNKQTNKAANLNIDEIIDYAYPQDTSNEKSEEKPAEKPVDKDKKEEEPKNEAQTKKPLGEKLPEEKKNKDKAEPKTNGKNKEATKAFDEDLAKLKEAAKKEEKKTGVLDGFKSLMGLTDLAKADKELKAALADKSKTLEDIQNLLDSFERKYKLSKADQAKLMDDNGEAIRALVEKDRNENFRPHIFSVNENGLNLDGKKFHVRTIYHSSMANGYIRKDQYFEIKLDDKLTVNNPSELPDMYIQGFKAAVPSYDKEKNTIRYTFIMDVTQNYAVPLDIPVDYNTDNITLDKDGEFVVTNSISGRGVVNPKNLLPQKVDKNGRQVGTIIEPGSDDVTQIIEPDDSNYKVILDASAKPVIKDKKIEGYNWTFRITSDTDLKALGYKANFTTVKGSGLGEITKVKIDGKPVELESQLNKNHELGIVSSKHHDLQESRKDITYDFYTGATEKQSSYLLDFSIALTEKGKVGAKRFVVDEAYTEAQISEVTPNRVGINNRTTILGEFRTEDTAQWTVTDAISTRDNKDINGKEISAKLPLETRDIDSKQSYNGSTGRSAVYYLDPKDGKMKQDTSYSRNNLSKFPVRFNLPDENQKVGTIAVYQFDTNLKEESIDGYSLSGVTINKYQPIKIKQTWVGIDSNKNMPAQQIDVKDADGNKLIEAPLDIAQGQPGIADREIDLPAVKTWKIRTEKNPNGDWYDTIKEKIKPVIVQALPGPTEPDIYGKTYTYKEKYNYYKLEDGAYHIYNVMSEYTNEKDADFTIIKTDRNDHSKRLAGAVFTLQSARETIKLETDANGRASFKNIRPGTYTLTENKAPSGYKLDQNSKQITVYNDGTVSVSGSNISMQGGKIPTKTARHNYYPSYPSYMNAMHYGKIDQNGNIEFYIYLKPDQNVGGGSTNKNTRLNLNLTGGGNITSVEVLDVAPGDRYTTRNKMQNQTAGTYEGNEVLNKDHANKIIGQDKVVDSYTGKTGYQIKFPESRFNGDWGFLVKVMASGASSTSTVSYDWLTDNASTQNEARIQESIGLSTAGDNEDGVLINIGNEAFPKSPVEVTKVKENGVDALTGATFALIDSKNNTIAHAKTGYDDKNPGLASFGNLSPGNYTIEESNPPNGYKKSNVVFDVNVAEDGKVTYKARFKDGNGTPIHGVDYFLEEIEIDDQLAKAEVTNIEQSMILQEKQNQPDDGRLGGLEGIWEAYGIESYRYEGSYSINNARKGGKFKIQFDPNLDFKRYVYEIPELKDGNGKLLAKPYFNYDTNLLTYVFEDDIEQANAAIKIVGIIPDKYYATQTDKDYGYNFNITVDPDNPDVASMQPEQTYPNRQTTKSTNNKLRVNIKTDYYAYDSQGGAGPLTSEYITDIYTDDKGQIYLKAVSYYNPTNMSSGPRKIRLDWMSIKKPRPGLEYYKADGLPAFSFDSLNVYKVTGSQARKQRLMPLSYGIRPEQDTSNYYRVYSKYNVNPDYGFSESGGDVTVTYRPEYLKSSQGLLDYGHEKHPLEISLPRVDGKEGYVMVQTFKVTDEKRFKDLWSAYYLSNGSRHTGSYQKGNYNWAIGSGTGKEIPKFYSQRVKLVNKKYVPGSFKIKKLNEDDDKPLQGAVFELRNEEGDVMNRFSGSDGIVEYKDLEPGIYTLQEVQAPNNFVKSNKRWQVIVYDTGDVVIREIGLGSTEYEGKDTIVIPVTNKPVGENFRIYKKDSDGNFLQGAKFKITKEDDPSVSQEKESDERGIVEFDKLKNGTYIIEETEAPEGYKKLDKKWVLVIDDKGKKVYNYREQSSGGSDLNSIVEKPDTNWVDVAGRILDGWGLYDNRRTDWTGNFPVPFKMGTRIVAINTTEKYVIQRYVLNPEAKSIAKTIATIHRQELNDPNMDWYNEEGVADKDYQVYTLDKEVKGEIADIRLAEYKPTNITKNVKASPDKTRYGEPARLKLEFPATDKPIVVDVKVPYKSTSGGVGTGMDWTENGTTYWKADFYERVNIIKETSPVLEQSSGIQGSYISDDFLDVENEAKTYGFKIKKVKEDDDTKVIQGAVFKLTGLGDSTYERTVRTGPNGIISFDGLKPGTYTLEETEPAPGYEKSNISWIVRVQTDGRVFIKTDTTSARSPEKPNASVSVPDNLSNPSADQGQAFKQIRSFRSAMLRSAHIPEEDTGLEIGENIISNPVRAGDGWEKVDPSKSEGREGIAHKNNLIETRITEINKDANRFKQVFLFKDGSPGSERLVELHRQPENSELAIKSGRNVDTIVKAYKVNASNIDDALNGSKTSFKVTTKQVTPTGKPRRVQFSIPGNQRGYILVEVETSYNGALGLGSDYKPNRTNLFTSYWAGDSYSNEAGVNKNKTQEPVITYEYESEFTEIPIVDYSNTPSKYVDDPNLEKGQYRIEEGTIGNKRTYYKYELKNGVRTGKKEIDTSKGNNGVKIINEMKPKLRYVGTKETSPTGFSVWVNSTKLSASPNSNVAPGTPVKVKVTPDSNEELDRLYYNDGNRDVDIDKNTMTFEMPSSHVTVSATFKPKSPATHKINIVPNTEHGSITAPDSASAGDTVTITSINPDPEYEIDRIEVQNQKGEVLATVDANNTFKMPDKDVYLKAFFKQKASSTQYAITINPDYITSVTLKTENNHGQKAEAGERVDVKVKVNDDRYLLEKIVVTYSANGREIKLEKTGPRSGYFIMPSADVSISTKLVGIPRGKYAVKISETENGYVDTDKITARPGEKVTLTPKPATGYKLASYKVTDGFGKNVPVDNNTFTMPGSTANVSATFVPDGQSPIKPGEEIEIPEGKFAQITNQQTGIELKIYKKSSLDAALKGAIFELKKTNDDYSQDDGSFKTVTAVSDENGNVRFEDENDKPIKLQVGKYILTETKPPAGFKKPPAPWKLEVVEEGGQLVIKQSGPKHSSTSYLSSEGAKAGETKAGDVIKYKSIIKNIDPVNKTFIQRIYIDTRGYKGSDKINVQITPTTKREEIDTPGAPPKTTSGGVKTAYRTTYKISEPGANPDVDEILKDYDLRKSNVSVVNTARWRPFDWGFDEDQINLSNDGVYFIDIEGFYDDNIIDLKEIELKVDFYGGERVFAQRTYENGKLGWKYDKDIGDTGGLQTKRDAAYQQGMEALYKYYSSLYGEAAAKKWFYGNSDKQKYDVWLRKGATVYGEYYDAGRIVLASDPTDPDNKLNTTPIQTSYTKANIKDLYSSDNISNVPQEGMTITNEDETYNITFSKHAKLKTDGSGEDYNANRLEGAVFKLEKKEGSFWYDVDDSYVASAFNGYFGFRRLEPGRYRLLEVTPPEGYKPIEGPLLEFTIKQLDTSSDKILNPKTQKEFNLIDLEIIDPYSQKKIALKNAKAKLKEDHNDTVYDFATLVKDEKFDLDTVIILSDVMDDNGDPKEITLKEASFIDPELNEPMGRIISGAQGFITLEYAPGGYVSEYGKAGSSGGSLVDYVTSATAKNMGKILNEKPGKGKVTIKKYDENGDPLGSIKKDRLKVGAKFEAVRISVKKDEKGNPITEAIYGGTVDEKGELVIDGLPIGHYELREVENPTGHINTGQVWHFTVGGKELDPYAGEIARTGNDLTSSISLEKSDLRVVRPNEEDRKATETEGNGVIRPHVGQSLEFDNSFKLKSNVKIRPGDYFVLKLSDNIDLEGVKKDVVGNLDIFADGVGTIAKADYDKQRGTITYTFTQYAEQYNLINFENKIAAHITFSKVRNSTKTQVGLSVGKTSKLHDIEVKYIVDTIERYYDNATVNLASKITEYNTNTGEFVHYFYVNRDRYYNAKVQYFEYKPSLDVENLQFTYYRLRNNSDYYINQSMPESFAVNEYDRNLYRAGGSSPQSVSANETMTRNIGNLGPNGSMIIKVTGRIKKDEKTKVLSYKGLSGLYSTYQYYYKVYDQYGRHVANEQATGIAPYVDRWDAIYEFDNTATASADLTINAVNPANKIKFKKVDPQGQAIKPVEGKRAAQFSLYKMENPNDSGSPVGNAKGVDEDGIIAYEKLEKGYYKLVETRAPEGFIKPTDPVAYFKVDETGKIYKEVTITKEDGKTEKVYEEVEGTIPINIVNNKPIEFEKVDANDKTNKLEGAVFKVLYKEKETDDYSDYKVDGKVLTGKSGKDGKLKLNITKSGYYALEETKAPEGYSKLPGYIKEFKLENGKVQIREKSIEKISHRRSSKGLMTSEILSVNKDDNTFTQRIVINPNHGDLKVQSYNSSINILENGWSIIPRVKDGVGGQIRVALIKKDDKKRISDLSKDDYKEYDAIASQYAQSGNSFVYRYGLKEMLGITDQTDNPITTTDAIVIEYTGKLNNINEVGQKLVAELSDSENDSLDYNLNSSKLAENKPTYVDRIQEEPIQIENKKVSLPNTNGLGAWIGFTILGLVFMTIAGFYYNKKKTIG